jgi:capsular polysaccharide transport system permease protein
VNALTTFRTLSRIIAQRPLAVTGKAADIYFAEAQRRDTIIRLMFLGFVAVPMVCATLYYGLWAAPRYVSEAQFLVTRPGAARSTGIDALMKSLGGSQQQVDDTGVVTGYLLSRDTVRAIERVLPLRDVFGRPEADLFSRFPRFWRSDSFERLFDYLQDRVCVVQDPKTSLTVLKVQAFRPEDAQALANAMLKLAEGAVNDLNHRAEADMLNFAWGELERAQKKLVDAQQAMTAFRTQELMVDPTKTSTAVLDTITKLSRDRVQVMAQRDQVMASAPKSPAVQGLTARADALQKQIDEARATLAGGDGSLAPTVSNYERLTLLRDLAEKDVGAAQTALELARQQAQQQHLYIQIPVTPNLADESLEPQRLRAIATVFVTGFAVFAFVWILMVGAGEHAHR